MRGIDLHTHSTRSDGTTTPAQTVRLAAEQGLAGLALSDHDTMDGWDEAAQECARAGLRFVPGVELSTELAGRSVHLLGYFVDRAYEPLVGECDRLRHERLRRATAIVERLAAMGVALELADVVRRAGDAPIGRPHIAAAMVAAGVVEDLDGAFDGYIEDGGPAYVAKHALSPQAGVSLIIDAGGAAVLAHPGISTRDAPVDLALLDRLVLSGLAGVEADHAAHDDEARRFWREAASTRGLYVTGSSDFHGTRKESLIGASTTDAAVVDGLERVAGARVAAAHKEASW